MPPAPTDDEQQKLDLLEKIKDAANGPEHAKRRIEALDKMVSGLKSNRRKCGEAMKKDGESIYWIDKEIEKINKRYLPLKERLKERKEERNRIAEQLKLAEDTMNTIMKQTKTTSINGRLSNAKMQKRAASNKLRETRGFGTDPSSTFRQKHKPRGW